MSYPQEVQSIFDLTLNLLDEDEQFNRDLLTRLRELCRTGEWEDEVAITNMIDHLIAKENQTNG